MQADRGARPRRGRRPSRTADQIRTDMLSAGIELVAERGLSIGFETVRFDDAILAASVPRASAYRAWSASSSAEGPQVRFHDALATRFLSEQSLGFDHLGGSLSLALEEINELLSTMPDVSTLTPPERGQWLAQVCRVFTAANQEALTSSPHWRSYVAVTASLMSMPGDHIPSEVLEAWRVGEEYLTGRYRDMYRAFSDLFGLRLRYCYDWDQFATASSALLEGLGLRANAVATTQIAMRRTGPDGASQAWTLAAIGVEALIRQFFEPDEASANRTVLGHEAG